jgi:hypothetical protein
VKFTATTWPGDRAEIRAHVASRIRCQTGEADQNEIGWSVIATSTDERQFQQSHLQSQRCQETLERRGINHNTNIDDKVMVYGELNVLSHALNITGYERRSKNN